MEQRQKLKQRCQKGNGIYCGKMLRDARSIWDPHKSVNQCFGSTTLTDYLLLFKILTSSDNLSCLRNLMSEFPLTKSCQMPLQSQADLTASYLNKLGASMMAMWKDHRFIIGFPTTAKSLSPAVLSLYTNACFNKFECWRHFYFCLSLKYRLLRKKEYFYNFIRN